MTTTPATTTRPPLRSLRVAVDVQHLYRAHKPRDRGSVYTLANGTHITEADATLVYAAALTEALRELGATVLVNDAKHGILTGYYSQRNRAATAWRADLYLACHLNAGRGSYTLAKYMRWNTPARHAAEHIAGRLDASEPRLLQAPHVVGMGASDRGAPCIQYCGPAVAAVLVEPFFGDNPAHQHLLATPELHRIGRVIARGVAAWWGRVLIPAARPAPELAPQRYAPPA